MGRGVHAIGRAPGRSRIRRVALLAGVVLAAASAPVAHAEPRSEEAQFFTLTNLLRVRHGLVPLVLDSQMTDVARAWSAVMAARGDLSHNPALEREVVDWKRLGENVGVGPTVESIQGAFEASPGHFRNLVDPAFRNVGIGVVDAGGLIWVTVAFKTPANGPAIPPVPALPLGTGEPAPSPVTTPEPIPAPRRPASPRPATEQSISTGPTPTSSAAPAVPPSIEAVPDSPQRPRPKTPLATTAPPDELGLIVPDVAAVILWIGTVMFALHRRAWRKSVS